MLLGRVFISFLFAEVAGYVRLQYSAFDEHSHKRSVALKWVDLNGVSVKVRNRVRRYFEFKWNNQKGVQEEPLIQDLPSALRTGVRCFLFDELIQNCNVFPRENLGAIQTITSRL